MGDITESNWYLGITYEEAKRFIDVNIGQIRRSFVAIGFYLKHIRDNEMYLEDGYKSIWEFAEDQYGISRSTATRWMQMNVRFSKDGNSPILAEQYKKFSKSQLQEILYLTDEQAAEVTEDMTVKEIREIRKPTEKEEGQKKCIAGKSKSGFCGAAAYCGEPVNCCAACKNDCNGRCGWLDEPVSPSGAVEDVQPKKPEVSIDELDFSIKTYNVLKSSGIDTLEQLMGLSQQDLMKLRGMGKRSLQEIEDALRESSEPDDDVPADPIPVPEPCATSHKEEEQQERDKAWFVKEYFRRYGEDALPELMQICREKKPMTDKVIAVKNLIGYSGGGSNEFGYNFGSYNQGVRFDANNWKAETSMTYREFILEMIKLYDPWDSRWLRKCEAIKEEMLDREGEKACDTGKSVDPDVIDAEFKECCEDAAEEPRFTSLFLKDILWDKERELKQMEECNVQPDGKLPERMMQEHRAVVAGLRLLLEYTEMRENTEEDEDDESR